MRTLRLMRTAFILMVTMVTLVRESDADIGTWIQLDEGAAMGGVWVLGAWKQRLYGRGKKWNLYLPRPWEHLADDLVQKPDFYDYNRWKYCVCGNMAQRYISVG